MRGGISRLLGGWLLAVALLPAGAAAQDAAAVFQLGRTEVVFAGQAAGAAALSAEDEWLAATSDFHRAATMGVAPPVTRERFREYLAGAALAWAPEQRARWRTALAALAPKLEALRVRLPAAVLLVQTTGGDSANAPYTRGNAVFLPIGSTHLKSHTDEELLAHELFHIVSRNDPALADRLYALFGFQRAAQLEWPSAWADIRIANPDAPHNRHVFRVAGEGASKAVMPVLVARTTSLKPGESFFDVMDVRLLVVEPGAAGQPTRAVPGPDGAPAWLPLGTPRYLEATAANTRYIIHPEEAAADNFAFLLSGRRVADPGLLRRFGEVFLAPR